MCGYFDEKQFGIIAIKKELLLDFFNNSIELISDYISQASQEYSIFERTRHKHFTYEGLEGSHKKAIKYWLEILDTGVHSFNDEISRIGEEIINRSTEEIQDFYKNIDDEENRQFFIQLLMKHEKKLLNLDKERYKKYKNATAEEGGVISPPKKQEKSKPQPTIEPTVKPITDEATIKAIRAKGKITVKEFEVVYGYGRTWQQQKRERLKDRLPYQQTKQNGKIFYLVNEVEEWFQNQI